MFRDSNIPVLDFFKFYFSLQLGWSLVSHDPGLDQQKEINGSQAASNHTAC